MALGGWTRGDKNHQTNGEYRTDNKQPSFHDVRTWSNVQAQPPPLSVTPKCNPDNRIS
jgi:hypothetical protein